MSDGARSLRCAVCVCVCVSDLLVISNIIVELSLDGEEGNALVLVRILRAEVRDRLKEDHQIASAHRHTMIPLGRQQREASAKQILIVRGRERAAREASPRRCNGAQC